MARRRFLLWGLLVAVAVPILMLVAATVYLMLSYDGTCGGVMPWLAAAKPCARTHYVLGTLSVIILLVWTAYWPAIVAWVGLPISIAYLLERRGDATRFGADRES
jgi:hypothetical protein